MTILLVEPDILLAKAYSTAMQEAGMKVQHVVDAQAAINMADACTPDIVVLEVQLVAHNGIEFMQEFRSYVEWGNIPIILHTFISPHLMQVHDKIMKQYGVGAILYKPQTALAKLVATIKEVAIQAHA